MIRANIPEPFVWNRDFDIGHHQSNVDNAFLFSQVGKLGTDEASAYLTQRFVETLKALFLRKESLLQSLNYSDCAIHICAHKTFLEDLNEVVVKHSKQSGLTLGTKGSAQRPSQHKGAERQLHRKETQKYERHRSKSVSKHHTLERAATRKKISKKSILSKLRRRSKEEEDVSDVDTDLPEFMRNDLRRNSTPNNELHRKIERRKSERQVLFDINFTVQQSVLYVNKLKASDILFVKNWIVGHIMHMETNLKDKLFGGKLGSLHANLENYDWTSAHEAFDVDDQLEELDSVPAVATSVSEASSPIGSVQLTDASTCCEDSFPSTNTTSRKENVKHKNTDQTAVNKNATRKLDSEPKSILRKPSLRRIFDVPKHSETDAVAKQGSDVQKTPNKAFIRRPTKFTDIAFDKNDSLEESTEIEAPSRNIESRPFMTTGLRKVFGAMPSTVGKPDDEVLGSEVDSTYDPVSVYSTRQSAVSIDSSPKSSPPSYHSNSSERMGSQQRHLRRPRKGKTLDSQASLNRQLPPVFAKDSLKNKESSSYEGRGFMGVPPAPQTPPLSPLLIPNSIIGVRPPSPTHTPAYRAEQRSPTVSKSPILVRSASPTFKTRQDPPRQTLALAADQAQVAPITFSALFNADAIVMASQGPWPSDDTKLRVKMLKVCQIVCNFAKKAVPIVLATPSFCELTEQDPWQLCGNPLMSLATATIDGHSSNGFIAAVNSLASAQQKDSKDIVDNLPKQPVFPIQVRKERSGAAMVCVIHMRVLSRRRRLLVASVADITNIPTFNFEDSSIVDAYEQIVRSSLGSKEFERVIKKFTVDTQCATKKRLLITETIAT